MTVKSRLPDLTNGPTGTRTGPEPPAQPSAEGEAHKDCATWVGVHTHTHTPHHPPALLTLIFVSYFVNLDRN